MAVYVGTESHFQSLANNHSSNHQGLICSFILLFSHFPQHEEEEGWKLGSSPSNLAVPRGTADLAKYVCDHGAKCGTWWVLNLKEAMSSSFQDCFHVPPGTHSHSAQSGLKHPLDLLGALGRSWSKRESRCCHQVALHGRNPLGGTHLPAAWGHRPFPAQHAPQMSSFAPRMKRRLGCWWGRSQGTPPGDKHLNVTSFGNQLKNKT